ncbi:hypothetical protein [Mycetocola saprophilus]|uniref:hypothetical protein n=1 Tax=Mycetocola saprophilus TaxID=76636 RepID=UPI003BEFC6A2
MTKIEVDRDSMGALLKNPETLAGDVVKELGAMPSGGDGGLASDKIAFILRAIMEASQLSADTANSVCAVGRAAIEDQMATEEEVMDSLDNFSARELG